MSEWIWEERGEGEFQTPEISSIYEGWKGWKGDMSSELSSHAEIFARELTQNFVDAAREHAAVNSLKPKLTFRFVRLTGADAEAFRAKFGLSGIAEQYAKLTGDDLRTLKLPVSEVLAKNSKDVPLLIVTESGTSGMLGPWERDHRHRDEFGNEIKRKMRDALLSTVGSKPEGGLGSYGEGKRAIIGASRTRTLLTYTCFDKESTEDGASRRLVGTTYWRAHNIGAIAYSGLAMFGEVTPNSARPKPWKDSQADAIVQELGIPGFEVRNPGDVSHWGTSQIFLEPEVEPEEIASALERNWWPLLVDGQVDFEILDYQGDPVKVNPEIRDELKPYIMAWKVLNKEEETPVQGEVVDITVDSNPAGELCLLADTEPGGWSFKDPEKNRSLVALIREGMIISYQEFPRDGSLPAPFVRGVYRVTRTRDGEIEKRLRAVEPPLHNYWYTKHKSMDRPSIKTANDVYKQLRDLTGEFRKRFVEEQERQNTDLALFDDLLSVKGTNKVIERVKPPPPPSKDDWSILSEGASVSAVDETVRRAEAKRKVILKKNKLPQKVTIKYGWEVQVDSGKWEKEPALNGPSIKLPAGFTSTAQGQIEGVLSPNDPVVLTWTSAGYSDLWTLRPYVQVVRAPALVSDKSLISTDEDETNG